MALVRRREAFSFWLLAREGEGRHRVTCMRLVCGRAGKSWLPARGYHIIDIMVVTHQTRDPSVHHKMRIRSLSGACPMCCPLLSV